MKDSQTERSLESLLFTVDMSVRKGPLPCKCLLTVTSTYMTPISKEVNIPENLSHYKRADSIMKATEDCVSVNLHIDPDLLDTMFRLGILNRPLNEYFESTHGLTYTAVPMR
jgi:hypothetical protein